MKPLRNHSTDTYICEDYNTIFSKNFTRARLVLVSICTIIASKTHSGSPFECFSNKYNWITLDNRLSLYGCKLSSAR